jgi:excisionase family DNA binding protein
MTAPLNLEDLWTVADVARLLRLKKSWVYEHVNNGTLPHLRLGGGPVRFVPDDVRAWVARQRSQPAKVVAIR